MKMQKVLKDYNAAYVYTKDELDEAMKKAPWSHKKWWKVKKMRIRLKPLRKPNAAEEIIAYLDIWRN